MGMSIHYLPLNISKDEWVRYYAMEATHIHCTTLGGKTIRISAHHFRKFTVESGVRGLFKLTLSGSRFHSLEKVS